MQLKSILLASALAIGSLAAQGAVVYDNGIASIVDGHTIGSSSSADDFSLATTSIVQNVSFYFNNYVGTSGWDGKISYAIRSDAAGNLGAVLATDEGQNVTQLGGGFAWCCGVQNSELISFDLVSAFTAAADQIYWQELFGAGGLTPWWVTSVNNTGYPGKSRGNSIGIDLAFFLSGERSTSNVPEPGSVTLLGLGLAGLAATRRRKRAK